MKITETHKLRELADEANNAAGGRRCSIVGAHYSDSDQDVAYLEGFEDALRFITGDTGPTAAMHALLADTLEA